MLFLQAGRIVWSGQHYRGDGKNICGFSGKTGEWCCYAWDSAS